MTTRMTPPPRFLRSTRRRLEQAVLRRLTAADGYLDLAMTDAALRELAAIEDAGHLAAAVDLLTGRVLMARGQYAAATIPLRHAAEALPTPFDRSVWAELETCFRAEGEDVLADVAAEFALTSGLPEEYDDVGAAPPVTAGADTAGVKTAGVETDRASLDATVVDEVDPIGAEFDPPPCR